MSQIPKAVIVTAIETKICPTARSTPISGKTSSWKNVTTTNKGMNKTLGPPADLRAWFHARCIAFLSQMLRNKNMVRLGAEDSIDDILKNLMAAVPDVVAAAVVSVEGLPISAFLPHGIEQARIAAMTAAILALGDRAAHELGKGMIEQIYVKGQLGYVLVMAAGSHAVLTLSTTAEVRLGVILLDAKRTCDRIAEIME
jgi:predicted regulator of Ras-like GTPase activity (Roadblock/LC7/MglB family)